jgi:hypothetical protein
MESCRRLGRGEVGNATKHGWENIHALLQTQKCSLANENLTLAFEFSAQATLIALAIGVGPQK